MREQSLMTAILNTRLSWINVQYLPYTGKTISIPKGFYNPKGPPAEFEDGGWLSQLEDYLSKEVI